MSAPPSVSPASNDVSTNFYKTAFWLLVTFMLGNGLGYLVFGLHAASAGDVHQVQEQTSRIERYLSSKDPNYWNQAKQFEDDPSQ